MPFLLLPILFEIGSIVLAGLAAGTATVVVITGIEHYSDLRKKAQSNAELARLLKARLNDLEAKHQKNTEAYRFLLEKYKDALGQLDRQRARA